MIYKDLLKLRQTPRPYVARLLVGVAGGASGFLVGYWAGSHYKTACDSNEAKGILLNDNAWEDLERTYFALSLLEMELGAHPAFFESGPRNLNPMEDDPLFACKTSLAATVESIGQGYDVKSADPDASSFQGLARIVTAYEQARVSSEYFQVQQMHPGWVLAQRPNSDQLRNLIGRYGYSPEAWATACAALDARMTDLLDEVQ